MSYRTLASSFNDNSIQQTHSLAVWKELLQSRKCINFATKFSKAENLVYYRVSVQNSQELTHSYHAVNTMISTVAGFCSLMLSPKYEQPNGRYVLDIRWPSKKKTQQISWITNCFSELNNYIIDYQKDENTPTIQIGILQKDESVKYCNYDPNIHGGFLVQSDTFATLGEELTVFPCKALACDEFKEDYCKFSNNTGGASHTKFTQLHDGNAWIKENGQTSIRVPKLRFHIYGTIQPTQFLRFFRAGIRLGDGQIIRFICCFENPSPAEFGAVLNCKGYTPKDFVRDILGPIFVSCSIDQRNVLFGNVNKFSFGAENDNTLGTSITYKWNHKQCEYIFSNYERQNLIFDNESNKPHSDFVTHMDFVISILYSNNEEVELDIEGEDEMEQKDQELQNEIKQNEASMRAMKESIESYSPPLDYKMFSEMCRDLTKINCDILNTFITFILKQDEYAQYSSKFQIADSAWNEDIVNHRENGMDIFGQEYNKWELKSSWNIGNDSNINLRERFGKNPNMVARESIIRSICRQTTNASLSLRRNYGLKISPIVLKEDVELASYISDIQTHNDELLYKILDSKQLIYKPINTPIGTNGDPHKDIGEVTDSMIEKMLKNMRNIKQMLEKGEYEKLQQCKPLFVLKKSWSKGKATLLGQGSRVYYKNWLKKGKARLPEFVPLCEQLKKLGFGQGVENTKEGYYFDKYDISLLTFEEDKDMLYNIYKYFQANIICEKEMMYCYLWDRIEDEIEILSNVSNDNNNNNNGQQLNGLNDNNNQQLN
eukprot:263756_1